MMVMLIIMMMIMVAMMIMMIIITISIIIIENLLFCGYTATLEMLFDTDHESGMGSDDS